MKVDWFRLQLEEDEIESVNNALKQGYVSGTSPIVEEFEKAICEYTGAKYGIATMNGTCSLIASLMALERKTDEFMDIIVPTWTFIATANAADLIGELILVDVDRDTFNLEKYDERYEENNCVIVTVDVGGIPSSQFYSSNFIVSDAAESLGATYKGRKVGTLADLTVLSFHATKILTTGEGGMVLTDYEELAKIVRQIVDQGYGKGQRNYYHPFKGYNFRMTSMQAALGLPQVNKIDERVKHRNKIAKIYQDIMGDLVEYQVVPKDCVSSYFLFTILIDRRDALKRFLFKSGIETKTWRPIHMQPPYWVLDNRGEFEVANYLYEHHLHLPMHNWIIEEEAKYVGEKVKEFLK